LAASIAKEAATSERRKRARRKEVQGAKPDKAKSTASYNKTSMGAAITSLVFQPPDVTYMYAKKHIIWLRTKSDANVPAFYIDRKASVTILFSHGNAEDLGMIYEWFCEFTREVQVNLLAYDYEGYGKATGTPSEKACYEDIDAAFAFLTDVLHQPPENIVLYGRSLGSGPSCYLAERLKVRVSNKNAALLSMRIACCGCVDVWMCVCV